ncbi:MAG: hypothetical protein JWN20_554, partial [Jatrophihabitantaceae bacterium]|nr:hypothetical protein [Jatrophihabitantaceae bacterium]
MSRRALFLLTALLAAATMLVACDKPLPKVTVSGDGNIVNLSASTYCFDDDHCRDGEVSDYSDAPVLKIGRGEDILVSVPKVVATGQWLVSAFRVDANGDQQAVEGLGTPTLHDVHTTRIQTAAAGDQGFFLGIIEFDDNAKDVTGTWVVQVHLE